MTASELPRISRPTRCLERNGYSGLKLQQLCDRTLKQLERSKMFLSLVDDPEMQKAV